MRLKCVLQAFLFTFGTSIRTSEISSSMFKVDTHTHKFNTKRVLNN